MLKLLIVDDEPDVCDFIKTFFGQRNCSVYAASNGDDALKILKRYNPSIVLLDIRMKGMDGLEVLKRMKEMDSGVCVIMVTAVEESEKIQKAYKLGASGYITKPLILEELEKIVMTKIEGAAGGKEE